MEEFDEHNEKIIVGNQFAAKRQGSISDINVDHYLSFVTDELSKQNKSLDQRMLVDNIIRTLDQLNVTESFSKALFFHIIKTGGFKTEAPILLIDFFRAYFKVYETMKTNRTDFANECNSLHAKIDTYNQKHNDIKTKEIVLENGLTNYSELTVTMHRLTNLNGPTSLNDYKLLIKAGSAASKEIELTESSVKKEISMKVENIDDKVTVECLKYDTNTGTWSTKQLDEFFVRDALEINLKRAYEVKPAKMKFSYLWIRSKLSHYSKLLSEAEADVLELQENIKIIDSSLYQLENPFAKHMRKSSAAATNDKEIASFKASESIENFILKLVGLNVVNWEKLFFFLNKLLLGLLIPILLVKPDFLTVLVGIMLLAVEFNILSSNYLSKLLIALAVSWGFDCLWLLHTISNWDTLLKTDGTKFGRGLRQVIVVASIVEIVLKLSMLFLIWRMVIVQKYYEVNPSARVASFTGSLSTVKRESNSSLNSLKKIPTRPRLKSTLNNNTQAGSSIAVRSIDF